jgi:hypothetical protein
MSVLAFDAIKSGVNGADAVFGNFFAGQQGSSAMAVFASPGAAAGLIPQQLAQRHALSRLPRKRHYAAYRS